MSMKKLYAFGILFSFISVSLWVIFTSLSIPENEEKTKATTGGELSFTIRTITASGTYAPKHVLAIWIENSGDFIKTRKAMANQRKQYLYTWKAASNYNVVDAITGSTLNSHQTHTVTWDCTNLDGNIVPDGDYDVYTEFTDKHAQGPLYVLSFTKGPDAMSLTPEDETYFKDIELDFTPFVSEFSADINAICQWGTITYTDESVNATSWEWDFGEGAAPASANTQGPHTVYYTTPGLKTVSLTINENVTEVKEDYISVTVIPTADFTFSSNALTVDFTNLSINSTSYLWEFGDGNTSTENNPTYTYSTAGTYDVTLNASYLNCEDYETLEVIVPLVNTHDLQIANDIKIYPNPNSGIFTLNPGNYISIQKIGIYTPSGKQLQVEAFREINGSMITVDVQQLERGIYFLRISDGDQVIIKKIVIR